MGKVAERDERDVEIGGVIDGNVAGREITVLRGGSIRGEVGGESVIIYGAVQGIVRALSIALHATARVEGELQYQTLTVDRGAKLEAKCIPS